MHKMGYAKALTYAIDDDNVVTGGFALATAKDSQLNSSMYYTVYLAMAEGATEAKRVLRKHKGNGQAALYALRQHCEADLTDQLRENLLDMEINRRDNLKLSSFRDMYAFILAYEEIVDRLEEKFSEIASESTKRTKVLSQAKTQSKYKILVEARKAMEKSDWKNLRQAFASKDLSERKEAAEAAAEIKAAKFHEVNAVSSVNAASASDSNPCYKCKKPGHKGPWDPACSFHNADFSQKERSPSKDLPYKGQRGICWKCGGKFPCEKCGQGTKNRANANLCEESACLPDSFADDFSGHFVLGATCERIPGSDGVSIESSYEDSRHSGGIEIPPEDVSDGELPDLVDASDEETSDEESDDELSEVEITNETLAAHCDKGAQTDPKNISGSENISGSRVTTPDSVPEAQSCPEALGAFPKHGRKVKQAESPRPTFAGSSTDQSTLREIPVDSGCTGGHVTNRISDINLNRVHDTSHRMTGAITAGGAAGSEYSGSMKGTILGMENPDGDTETPFPAVIPGLTYYPGASKALLSADLFAEHGWIFSTGKQYGTLRHQESGRTIRLRKDKAGLYLLRIQVQNAPADITERRKNTEALSMGPMESQKMLAHYRLGHIHSEGLERAREMCKGVQFTGKSPMGFCEICPVGKSHKLPVPKSALRSEEFCGRWFFDMHGPYGSTGTRGEKYTGLFLEDSVSLYLLYSYKDKTGETMVATMTAWHQQVRRLVGEDFMTIKLRMDGDPSSNDIKAVRAWCDAAQSPAVQLESSGTYTPQQMGRVERAWRTIFGMAKCMLKYAGLPDMFIFLAMHHAVWLVIRLPTSALNGRVTLEIVWAKPADLSMARIFGCIAYAHVEHCDRGKMGDQSRLGIYVGVKGVNYQIYTGGKAPHDVISRRDVVFDESWRGPAKSDQATDTAGDAGPDQNPTTDNNPVDRAVDPTAADRPDLAAAPADSGDSHQTPQDAATVTIPVGTPIPATPMEGVENPADSERTDTDPGQQAPTVPTETADDATSAPQANVASGNRKVTFESHHEDEIPLYDAEIMGARHKNYSVRYPNNHYCMATEVEHRTPQTYEEAISGPDATQWQKAMQEELESLRVNDTWQEEPSDRVSSGDIVTGKWVYRLKTDDQNRVTQFKARYVARGFTQRYGVNYEETHAPVVRMQNVHLLMALCATHGFELEQADINTAYLYGEIDADVFVAPPKGYRQESSGNIVLRLKKGLYGLKQSGALWNRRLVDYLISIGYTQMKSDKCIFTYRGPNNTLVIVAIYVDDILCAGTPKAAIADFLDKMESEFRMKRLGNLAWYCNMTVERNREPGGYIKVHQEAYVKSMLQEYGLQDCNPRTEPMAHGTDVFELSRTGTPLRPDQNFRGAVGKLIWITITRPTILQTVGLLTRIMHEATAQHFELAKGIMRYLAKDPKRGLLYRNNPVSKANILVAYVDASHGDMDEFAPDGIGRRRKSTTGYTIMMNDGVVSRLSKGQERTAMSSTEAETDALKSCTQEVMYLRNLLEELGFPLSEPTDVFVDNSGTVSWANNPGQYHGRRSMRHLELRNAMIRENIHLRIIMVCKVHTDDNLADIMTKIMKPAGFHHIGNQIEG